MSNKQQKTSKAANIVQDAENSLQTASYNLRAEQIEAVIALAIKQDRSASSVVRAALDAYLNSQKPE